MSRREIRRMLMGEPRPKLSERPWIVPVLMALVLIVGVGIGVGVGLSLMKDKPEATANDAAQSRSDQAAQVAGPSDPPTPHSPIVAVPAPRPGGPADEPDPAIPPVPPVETAVPLILPQPPVAPLQPDSPAWLRHAVSAPRTAGRPMVAVVIDDMGVDKKRSERVAQLRAPLTLAYMTYADNLRQVTAQARQRGHELMLHVPMQPQGESYDPGREVLEVNLPAEEIRRRLVWGLDRFDGFVGINNHMGSRFTGDRAGMRVVMEELKKRGLLFLDSVTTERSVGPELARGFGIPFAVRNVFIDNEQKVHAVKAQLAKAEAHARKHGTAIAIGHPHDATIEALEDWLPGLEARGIVLVPLTAIVKAER